jgi:multidrug resistance efflux pump
MRAQRPGLRFARRKTPQLWLVLLITAGLGYAAYANFWPTAPKPGAASHAPTAAAPSSSPAIAVSADTAVGKAEVDKTKAASNEKADKPAPAAVPPDTHITARGVVTYDETRVVRLTCRSNGSVWQVRCHPGQPIRKGDILAIVELPELGKLKSAFVEALIHSQLKADTLARLKRVDASIPERDLREAEADLRHARLAALDAQQSIVNLGLAVRLEDFAGLTDEQLVRRVQFLGLPERLSEGFDPAETSGNLLAITAPIDGQFIGPILGNGQVVTSTEPQLLVADTSRMSIRLEVEKQDAALVSLGQPVSFHVDGSGDEIRSHVAWISPEIEAHSGTLTARADFENPWIQSVSTAMPQRLLRANTRGTARLDVRRESTQEGKGAPRATVILTRSPADLAASAAASPPPKPDAEPTEP